LVPQVAQVTAIDMADDLPNQLVYRTGRMDKLSGPIISSPVTI